MVPDDSEYLELVPLVESSFFFQEAFYDGKAIDAEPERSLPAVDGAIQVFRDIFWRRLPPFALLRFFRGLPFCAGGRVGRLECRDSGSR